MMAGMRKPLYVRPLLDDEREKLEAGLRSREAFVLRRCQKSLATGNLHHSGISS